MAGLPSSLVWHSSYHVTNSIEFVHTLGSLWVELEDLIISFDIVFLFTRVPVVVSPNLLRQQFIENILALFRYVLTSTYFSFGGQFYEQTDGMPMGSPIPPIITNFFMEDT
jgi:hypothetical protein